MRTSLLLLLTTLLLSATTSCDKTHSCYDPKLVHDGPCPAHCPGVKACNGETYCNECEAARHGYSVQ
jgi:hypothetical protein